ncbi:hypothetical protein V1503_19675 [Bacillus sp. SCS-151]|uniref:hypothetical protein n=1 Tax=Nanhaiella sioensis TaxID=3115293 RepID=UPI00397BE5C1
MKKNKLILFILIGVLFTSVMVGFNNKETYDFKLDVNNQVLDFLEKESNPVIEKNEKKFGKKENEPNLKLDLEIVNDETEVFDSFKIIGAKVKGSIKTLESTFPFDGEGDLNLISFNDREIYYGSVGIKIKNKSVEEEGALSIRLDPETNEVDVTITSGVIGDTAMLPFGTLFLTNEDLDAIDAIIRY